MKAIVGSSPRLPTRSGESIKKHFPKNDRDVGLVKNCKKSMGTRINRRKKSKGTRKYTMS